MLYPRLVWRVPTDQNKIYLTFDDGPVPGPTEFVLDQLNVFKAKATFFCIGSNVEKNQTIFSQILNAGHAVGNHTQNHRKGWATSNDEYIKDIMACQNLMKGTTLFRPPYGRIKRSQARQLGLFKIIMWDVLSYDYSRSVTEARCLKGVVRAVRPGSIVVFHDSYKAEKKMTRVLPLFLDHFAQKGFAFETLSVLE